MHLTYRPANAGDIDACLEMLPGGFPVPFRARLAQAWHAWLRDGIMQMVVLEDAHRPPDDRRIAFGSSVFVSAEFAEEAKTTLPPPLAAQVVRRWHTGCSPVLSLDAVREANSGPGLTLLVLHIGWLPRLSADDVRWAKARLLEALLFFHSGYLLNEVLQEVISEDERDRGLAAGASVKNDYAAFYAAHPELLPPPEHRPFLIGGSRAETRDGSYLSPLFFYRPPHFFFKRGEQELLRLALLDCEDEAVVSELHLSSSTIQKRWRTIYDRVTLAEPGFFPLGGSADSGTRGAAKRRRLLSYLRGHPEEMHPVHAPRRSEMRGASVRRAPQTPAPPSRSIRPSETSVEASGTGALLLPGTVTRKSWLASGSVEDGSSPPVRANVPVYTPGTAVSESIFTSKKPP